MGGSAGKLAVIVASIVAGVLLIAKGFDGGTPTPTPTTTESQTGTPTTEPTGTTEPTETACQPAGVGVQTFNGTSVGGLAAFASGEIQAAGQGWVLVEPDNTEPLESTVVYFRTAERRPEATCLRDDFFPGAEVRKLPASAVDLVDPGADIAVFLGNDYAVAHPQ